MEVKPGAGPLLQVGALRDEQDGRTDELRASDDGQETFRVAEPLKGLEKVGRVADILDASRDHGEREPGRHPAGTL